MNKRHLIAMMDWSHCSPAAATEPHGTRASRMREKRLVRNALNQLKELAVTPPERKVPEDGALILNVWASVCLAAKIRIVQTMLEQDHPLTPALRESAALEELRRRGTDLENWIVNYPILFADSAAKSMVYQKVDDTPVNALAVNVLKEARETLESNLRAIGLVWITVKPGAPLTSDCEVVGNEESRSLPGTAARMVRAGFKLRGRTMAPVQVMRSVKGHKEPLQTENIQPIAEVGYVSQQSQTPDWLMTLQRKEATDAGGPTDILRSLEALVDIRLASDNEAAAFLAPLLAYLGPRYSVALSGTNPSWSNALVEIRDSILIWLKSEMSVELIAPAGGEPFDAQSMKTIGFRRTAHLHEDGLVAKLEQIGIRRDGRILLQAQVTVYDIGDGA